jgi:hypothetical protein
MLDHAFVINLCGETYAVLDYGSKLKVKGCLITHVID